MVMADEQYVPFQSVQYNKGDKSFYYNSDYDCYALPFRRHLDWQIVDVTRGVITLDFNLDSSFLANCSIHFWKKFYQDPREMLGPDELVIDQIRGYEPYSTACWPSCQYAQLSITAPWPRQFENLGHKFFVFGDTLQKSFELYRRDPDQPTPKGAPIHRYSLAEFADFVFGPPWPVPMAAKQAQSQTHMRFLMGLPSWPTRLANWRGFPESVQIPA